MKEIEFENSIKNILEFIDEDVTREGLLDTPKRVRKAYEFMFSGYKLDPKEIIQKALFTSTNDEMVVVKDIEFYSFCEHHMLPIIGKAHVAYIPNGKVVGLSKIPRVVDVFARRLQIQEQFTEQICDALNEHLKPKGVAVIVDARHMCMEMRGVQKICSTTITSSLRGLFKSDKKTKDEFLSIVSASFQKQIINPKHLQEKLEDALKKYLDKKISNSRKYVYDIIANRFKIRGKND